MVSSVLSRHEGCGLNARAFLCGICMFYLLVHGFSPGNTASSHSPKTRMCDELGTD